MAPRRGKLARGQCYLLRYRNIRGVPRRGLVPGRNLPVRNRWDAGAGRRAERVRVPRARGGSDCGPAVPRAAWSRGRAAGAGFGGRDGAGRDVPPCPPVRAEFRPACDGAGPASVAEGGISAACSAAAAGSLAPSAARRENASTRPLTSSSISLTSHLGISHPARAASEWIRASMAIPNRSAGGKGGMLFTPCSYTDRRRLGKRKNNSLRLVGPLRPLRFRVWRAKIPACPLGATIISCYFVL